MDTGTTVVFVAVVGARFLRTAVHPAVPAAGRSSPALVLDGVDQTIFQAFGYDPPGYQGYDKAMDVFYLSMAYLSTLRNWTEHAGVPASARFLYFYRLVGGVAFELTHVRVGCCWSSRTCSSTSSSPTRPCVAVEPVQLNGAVLGGSARRRSGSSSSCHRSTGCTSRSSTSPRDRPRTVDHRRCVTVVLLGRRRWSSGTGAATAVAAGLVAEARAEPLPGRDRRAEAQRDAWVRRHGANALHSARWRRSCSSAWSCVIYGQVLPDVRSQPARAVPRRRRLRGRQRGPQPRRSPGAPGAVDCAVLAFGVRVVVNVVLVLLARRGCSAAATAA